MHDGVHNVVSIPIINFNHGVIEMFPNASASSNRPLHLGPHDLLEWALKYYVLERLFPMVTEAAL